MNILRKLFTKDKNFPPDPTTDWPSTLLDNLTLSPYEGQFCNIRFGSPIEYAKALGRPSRFRWTQDNYCELLYNHSGFQIDYDSGRLAYIAIFFDQHVAPPDTTYGFNFAVVDLRTPDGRAYKLSQDTRRDVIDSIFGSPSSIDDTDTSEVILSYKISEVTIECEIHPTKSTIMRLNAYPTSEG